MDTFEAIYGRRSIRKYTDQPLPEDFLEEVLKAAMAAPSAGNQQCWQFYVVDDRRILQRITEVHPYSAMLNEAAAAIVVCGDLELEKHPDYWVQDCSAATQNILLAAHALGLGAVWLGVFPRLERVRGVQTLLGLPEKHVPLAIVSMGFPREEKAPAGRFKPERVHQVTS